MAKAGYNAQVLPGAEIYLVGRTMKLALRLSSESWLGHTPSFRALVLAFWFYTSMRFRRQKRQALSSPCLSICSY